MAIKLEGKIMELRVCKVHGAVKMSDGRLVKPEEFLRQTLEFMIKHDISALVPLPEECDCENHIHHAEGGNDASQDHRTPNGDQRAVLSI